MAKPWNSNVGWLIALVVLIVAIVDLVAPGVDIPTAAYVLALALAILL